MLDWNTIASITTLEHYKFCAEERRRIVLEFYNKIVRDSEVSNAQIEMVWRKSLRNIDVRLSFSEWLFLQPDYKGESLEDFEWHHVLKFLSHTAHVSEMAYVVKDSSR